MEIKGDGNKSDPDENGWSEFNDGELPPPTSMTFKGTLLLENTGEAAVTHHSHGLSWKLLDPFPELESCCAELKALPRDENGIKFDEVYGVAFIGHGLIRSSSSKKQIFNRESNDSEMYRFTVHGSMKSHAQPCLLVLVSYTFGHNDMQVCQAWVDRISASLSKESGRPKKLLVLVNPLSGKTNGCRIWETVAPIFLHAKVETQVTVTERAGHAFDVMAYTANKDLITYDGVIVVGGDGFFNEVLNGFLLSRHKAPYPPSPSDFLHSGQSNDSVNSPTETMAETANHNEVSAPLLSDSTINGLAQANFRSEGGSSCETDEDLEFPLPSERFRFGIIPAGSTDAIVMCTTGTRDPITSALQIVLGKRVSLDVAQVVRWKTTSASAIEPCIRYATSFAGYGFYGDVIQESEKYRWMGPKRYDYAGTKVFLKHSLKTEASVLPLCMKLETAVKEWPWNDCNTSCFGSYEAEVAYLETESDKTNSTAWNGHLLSRVKLMLGQAKSERVICRRNCHICNTNTVYGSKRSAGGTPYSRPEETKWGRSKGRFLSVGAAIISNRNEKAPDGLVADAHLSDGFLHLLLIRECPRASYLWHLTQLTKKGGRPLNFGFVEHHKTRAFTFTSIGKESIWNLDGELFPAHRLSAQVFRGLISLFASGPEA